MITIMQLNYKLRSLAGSTPSSYLGGPRFEVSLYKPALLIEVSCEFYGLFQGNGGIPLICSPLFLINY
jgi:hypothetical protein